MSDAALPTKTRNTVRELLVLLRDNQLLTDKECATVLGIAERTVYILRKSDAFKGVLAKMIDEQHGDAIRAVRNNTLVAANEALETTRRIMKDPTALPSLKLEAVKLALEQHNKTEQRELDARLPPPPPTNPSQQVNVSISIEDLQSARQAALGAGAAITLEPSESAHSVGVHSARPMLGSLTKERPPIRSERGQKTE